MKWFNQWVDALLGLEPSLRAERSNPWIATSPTVPRNDESVAYLDPFANMSPDKSPTLYLKPQDINQTLGMCEVLFNTSGIDAIVIDSFFWLPGTTREFEQGIRTIMRAAKRAQKKIYFLGPSNKMQDVVLGNVAYNDLISFKSHGNDATLIGS
jgi:hypothetical protein